MRHDDATRPSIERSIGRAALCGLSIVAVVLLLGNAGDLKRALQDAWAGTFVLGVLAGALLLRGVPERRRLRVIAFSIAAAGAFLVVVVPVPARPAVFGAALLALTLLPSSADEDAGIRALGFGCAVGGLWIVLARATRIGHFASEGWAAGLSDALEGIFVDAAFVGPTGAAVPSALVACGIAIAGPRRTALRVAWSVIAVILTQTAVLVVAPAIAGTLSTWLHEPWTALDLFWLHAVAQGVVVAHVAFARGEATPAAARRTTVFAATATLAAATFAVAAGGWVPSVSRAAGAGTLVVFHDAGYLDRRVPEDGVYGRRAPGMFGSFPGFVRSLGYEFRNVDVTRDPQWRDAKVLVFVNLMETLPPETSREVAEFVANGGGVLVLGDHTGQTRIRLPSNDIVERFGIALEFDAAKPFRRSWADGKRIVPHPVTEGVEQDWDTQIWIGASLAIRPPAYPIVLGVTAFSDSGDPDNPEGNLGNMRYDQGERLGDVVLAAAAESGAGRVLVFGDTSPIQNGALFDSRRLVANALAWLSGASSAAAEPVTRDACAGISAACLGGVAALGASESAVVLLAASIGAAGLALIGSGVARTRQLVSLHDARVAHVATAVCPRVDRLGWGKNALLGFQLALMRSGYVPYAVDHARDPDVLEEASVVALISPVRSLERAQEDALVAWMEAGGTLVLSAGRPESDAVKSLLGRLRLSVGRGPLGSVTCESRLGPVRMYDAYALDVPADVEVVARGRGHATVAWRPVGAGAAVVIGDSQFLKNKNLEDIDAYVPENVRFLRALLDEITARSEARRRERR